MIDYEVLIAWIANNDCCIAEFEEKILFVKITIKME
jgi:hypothetical protein